jgi:hypothetical protein
MKRTPEEKYKDDALLSFIGMVGFMVTIFVMILVEKC